MRKGTLIRTDKNGTKYFEGLIPCSRCNGEGVYIIGVNNGQPVLSPVDGGICFRCGGTKVERGKWKEYTPEYEAKLEARRRKAAEKRAAEIAQKEAEEAQARAEAAQARAEAEAREKAEREAEEARIREEKKISQHIGEIGDKIEIKATFIKTAWFEVPSFGGWGTDTMHIHTFKDESGNVLIWKTTKGLPLNIEEGDSINLKGTIKEHSEYKDEKQTVLTRCRIS